MERALAVFQKLNRGELQQNRIPKKGESFMKRCPPIFMGENWHLCQARKTEVGIKYPKISSAHQQAFILSTSVGVCRNHVTNTKKLLDLADFSFKAWAASNEGKVINESDISRGISERI